MQFMTAGESHGPQLTGILTGVPANLTLDVDAINAALAKRQGGYGRGARQKIEHDTIHLLGGVRHGQTLGGPIALAILNRDHSHWQAIMDPAAAATAENTVRQVTRPRAGHADLAGGMKYRQRDLRNVLERSSARETAMKVALGAIAKQLLAALDIQIVGYVTAVGGISGGKALGLTADQIEARIAENDLRILDSNQTPAIHAAIDEARKAGDTLGGTVQVLAFNLPSGVGSYTAADTKLDAKLAAAVMGVNAIKAVSFGDGFDLAAAHGSQVMDAITWNSQTKWQRASDHLGGFEGGMTNGMPVVINAAMKPIPTLYHPLASVNIQTHEVEKANVERSDTTAIVPASLVVESAAALCLADAITAQFGQDELGRLKTSVAAYRKEIAEF